MLQVAKAVEVPASARDAVARRLLDSCDYGWPSECWPWKGYIKPDGYAKTKYMGRSIGPHRLAYACRHGVCPGGENVVVDHKCGNRSCINPDHLRVVTTAENIQAGNAPSVVIGRLGVCPNGHKIEGDNLLIQKSGKKLCKACHKARAKARVARLMAAGLCRRCGKLPHRRGLGTCDKCGALERDKRRERVSAWRRDGLCPGCGKRPPAEGYAVCSECTESGADRTRKYKERQKAHKQRSKTHV